MLLGLTRLSEREARELLAEPEGVIDFLEAEDHAMADVDKAWDAINFLLVKLCGEEGGFLLAGGQEVGEDDEAMVAPRLFLPAEAASAARILEGVSEEDLRAAYVPKELIAHEVYPNIWGRDPKDDDALGYVAENYNHLREFVMDTAREGAAMIVDLG